MKAIISKIFARKKKFEDFDFSSIKSVLIRPIGTGLGDAIILTAVLKQLKEAYPNIKTGVLAVKRNEIVFRNNPFVDKVIKDNFIAHFSNRGKWQIFIDYIPSFTTRNIIFDFILKPKYTISFQKKEKKYYNINTIQNIDYYIPDLARTHLSKSLELTPFKPYIKTADPEYSLPEIPKECEEKAKKLLHKEKANVVLSPSGTDRKINPEEIREILKSAFEGKEDQVNLIIPFTRDSAEYISVLRDLRPSQTPPLSTEEFFALIKNADMIISVDSAAVHIACAYRKDLLAFYSGWERNFKLFAPLKADNAIAIQSEISASAPVKEIKALPVEKAVASIRKLLHNKI